MIGLLKRYAALVVLAVVLLVVWALNMRSGKVTADILEPRIDSALVAAHAAARVRDSAQVAMAAWRDSVEQEQRRRDQKAAVLIDQAATAHDQARTMAEAARIAGDTASLAFAAYEKAAVSIVAFERAVFVKDSTITAERASVKKLERALASADSSAKEFEALTVYLRAAVDRAVRSKKKTRDWSLGLTGGVGCGTDLSGRSADCGPQIVVGISRRIF